MIDFETLDDKATSVPIQLGACKFRLDTGKILDKFVVNIEARSGKDLGLTISKSTIDWWKTQDPKIMKEITSNPYPIGEAMQMFDDWIGNDSYMVWSNGASFDIPLLEVIYRKLGKETKFKYWDQCCYRTILNMFDLSNKKLRGAQEGTLHNAADDAIGQAKILMEIFKESEAF
jgi:hypothetical protein